MSDKYWITFYKKNYFKYHVEYHKGFLCRVYENKMNYIRAC